mgnify:CR=1 FL=1
MSLVRGEICTSMTRRMLYRFEDFEIDSGSMRLFKSGEPVAAEPQVIMLLLLLVRKHGETVTKAEINDAVWDGRIVSASALTSRLRAARAAIDDDGSSQRLIRTNHTEGHQQHDRTQKNHVSTDPSQRHHRAESDPRVGGT